MHEWVGSETTGHDVGRHPSRRHRRKHPPWCTAARGLRGHERRGAGDDPGGTTTTAAAGGTADRGSAAGAAQLDHGFAGVEVMGHGGLGAHAAATDWKGNGVVHLHVRLFDGWSEDKETVKKPSSFN